MNDAPFYIDTVCGDVSDFDCGKTVFNEYLKNRNDSSVVHYVIDADTDNLMGYFSLLSSALLSEEEKHLDAIPAIELKMFALDKSFQGTGLAFVVLDAILETITHYATDYVGAKIILLYAVPVDAVTGLYESAGFQRTAGLLTAYKSYFNEGCIPMFKVL
jgi:GNAT superfamily N-acetyltransferase